MFRTQHMMVGTLITAAALTVGADASASGNSVFELQGTAENVAGIDPTHAGPGASFFQGVEETGISTIASDLAAGIDGNPHFPDFSAPWVSPDGIIDWAYWDPADGPATQGPEVLSSTGQRVYQDPASQDFFFYNTDTDAAGSGHDKLYYAADVQSIGALSFGNFGTQPGATRDWQQAVPTEFDLQQAHDGGFGGAELVSATFTIWIDDVINFGLTPSTLVELPSQAFVNVYDGSGDLTNYDTVQSRFDLSDQATAADSVDLVYEDPQMVIRPVTRTALALASVFEGIDRLRFDFDVTAEVAVLLDQDADYAGIILGATPDGDFTLGSIDAVVKDPQTGAVLENYLPMLTLAFAAGSSADLDQDGDVDDADFALFFAAFSGPGVPTGNPAADLDGDTDTDDADFGLAFAAFTGPGAAASIPEPTSLALLIVGGLMTLRCRRPLV